MLANSAGFMRALMSDPVRTESKNGPPMNADERG